MKAFRFIGTTFVGILLSLLFVSVAHAATFTVTSTADDPAITPALGCATVLPDCTLRSAIEAANAQAGADVINFNIAGAGVHTISPASQLPQVDEQTTIDGTTQPGASCGTLVPTNLPAGSNSPHVLLIEVDGTNSSGGNIVIGSGATGSIVRGLVVNNTQGNNSQVSTNADNVIVECNYIGTNAAGTVAASNNTASGIVGNGDNVVYQNNLVSGNVDSGINLSGNNNSSTVQNNLVGTTADGLSKLANNQNGVDAGNYVYILHNIVSGNGSTGVDMANGIQQVVQSNYIGLSLSGSAMGNTGNGVLTGRGTNNYQIGGSSAGQGNVISANGGNGIGIVNQSGGGCPSNTDSSIFGNKIGTDSSGLVQAGFGNKESGIVAYETEGIQCISSVYKHQIGGDNSGEPNIIAGNSLDGVRIFQVVSQTINTDVFSVSVLTNSIYGNGNLGINLAANTNNDANANTDLGPNVINNFLMSYPASNANYYINRPTLNFSSFSGNQVTVNYDYQAQGVQNSLDGYSLLSTDLVGFRLDFYLNDNAQDGAYANYNQGKIHLGSFIVDGSESGATHTFTSPITPAAGQSVSATATALWKNITFPCPTPGRFGDGPPYYSTSCE